MKFISKIAVFVFLIYGNVNAQNFDWLIPQNPLGELTCTDKDNSLYIAGSVSGSADMDPGPGTFFLAGSLFVQKLDSSGNFLWAKEIGGSVLASICIDSNNNILVTGSFETSIDADPGPGIHTLTPASGFKDIFLVKLDNNGNFVWGYGLGGVNDDSGLDVDVDKNNNVYFVGFFGSPIIDFDPGPGIYNLGTTGSHDGYILKLTSSGSFIWAKKFGSANADNCGSISIDTSDNVLITGTFGGTIDFDPGPATYFMGTYMGTGDTYVLKLTDSANFVWVKNIYGDSGEQPTYIGTDLDNNVLIHGWFSSSQLYITSPINSVTFHGGSSDLYTVKLNSSGIFLWANSFGNSNSETVGSITMDKLGNVYSTSFFLDTIDFDPGPGISKINVVPAGVLNNLYVQKLDKNGKFVWAHNLATTSIGESIIVDDNSSIYVTGSYAPNYGDFDFGYGVHYGAIGFGSTSFVLKMSQDTCSDLVLYVDSVSNAGCIVQGFCLSHASGGLRPYSYEWNSSPITSDSSAYINTLGIYTAKVTAVNGCVDSISVFVEGPDALAGFDLKTNLITSSFRPGFPSTLWADGFNDACDSISGNLIVVLDPLTSFVSSTPLPDYISGDTLKWNFTSITYDSLHIDPQIKVSTSALAVIGDSVCFSMIISPSLGDIDTGNNVKNYCYPIINGYDPNEKYVYPQGQCTKKFTLEGEKLTYTVKFQNTGNASAVNIYVMDTLDVNLDLSSVNVISHSHPMITEILPGNVLRFRFDDIYLPDSTSDETNSHGYVLYEIDPFTSLPFATNITNKVNIYFDYNEPIITNTTVNCIVDTLPIFGLTQNITLLCGSNYVFPDGTVFNDLHDDTSHLSVFSPVFYCDSTVMTNIQVISFNADVTQTGLILSALATGVSYQWIYCDFSNQPIPDETNQTFTATFDGNYAVIVSNGSCIDTSICYNISGVGLANLNDENNISVYPNPTNNSITISTSNIIANKIELKDVYGRTIKTVQPNSSSTTMDLQNIENGIYFVCVINENSQQTVKIVKQ